jgi:glyoxylate reductase
MKQKPKVLITVDLPKVAYDYLQKRFAVTWNKPQLTHDQLVKKVAPFQAVLATIADKVDETIFAAASQLRVVANMAVGFNNIDLQAARQRGVVVTNTPDVLTDATADLTWALLLASARRLPEGERLLQSGLFKGVHPLMLLGLDLKGKTLGIYGCGRIGQAVAKRARGWDMPVLYHNRKRLKPQTERKLNAKYASFEQLLQRSDFLCVTAPLTDETRGRFTLKEFKKMKRTAIFINTGRGPIHREADLAKALEKRFIQYAGLDVYENEPKVDPQILKSDRVTLLPHLGSATVDTRNAMAMLAAKNIERVLNGDKPITPVT